MPRFSTSCLKCQRELIGSRGVRTYEDEVEQMKDVGRDKIERLKKEKIGGDGDSLREIFNQ